VLSQGPERSRSSHQKGFFLSQRAEKTRIPTSPPQPCYEFFFRKPRSAPLAESAANGCPIKWHFGQFLDTLAIPAANFYSNPEAAPFTCPFPVVPTLSPITSFPPPEDDCRGISWRSVRKTFVPTVPFWCGSSIFMSATL